MSDILGSGFCSYLPLVRNSPVGERSYRDLITNRDVELENRSRDRETEGEDGDQELRYFKCRRESRDPNMEGFH